MWYINIQDWLDETRTGPGTPRLKSKVKKLAEIITWLTSDMVGIPVGSPPRCWRKPGRKPCPGILDVSFNPDNGQIVWYCEECGDEGTISGWEGLIWDMTDAYTNEIVH